MRPLTVNNHILLKKYVLVQLTLSLKLCYIYDKSIIFLNFVFLIIAFCCNIFFHIVILMLFHLATTLTSESLYKSLNIYLYFIPLPQNLTTGLKVIFNVTPNLFCITASMSRLCGLYTLNIWQMGAHFSHYLRYCFHYLQLRRHNQ